MNDHLGSRSSACYDDHTSALSVAGTGIVEIPLLLSAGQASALESAAYRRGMTAAEMVRQLLREFISTAQ